MCLLLSLDIQNAFNSASWDHIIEELERKNFSKPLVKIIQSYLSDRNIILDQNTEIAINSGVPQGSVLWPTLWNIQYVEHPV